MAESSEDRPSNLEYQESVEGAESIIGTTLNLVTGVLACHYLHNEGLL